MLDVLDTVKPGHDILFTDFVNIDMPDVLDIVKPGRDLLFTDLVSVDMYVAPIRLGPKTCLICYFDLSLGIGRTVVSKFPRQDSMQRYARLLHFPKGQYRVCPDSACVGQVFDYLDHFKKIPGHIAEYLQQGGDIKGGDIKDEKAAHYGITHGVKLLVIQELLRRCQEGSVQMHDYEDMDAFSAIMAFQFALCRRIRYTDVAVLIAELRSPRFNHIWQLAKESSHWFRTCQALHAGMDLPLLTLDAHNQSSQYQHHASCVNWEKAKNRSYRIRTGRH
jgi:hypothetical protein